MERYPDIMAAFYGINQGLLFSDTTKTIVHAYNYSFEVFPRVDKTINFTKLVNYTSAKWQGLVGNYLDFSSFTSFKDKVNTRLGKKHWAETMKFSHNTLAREACLISATAMNDGENNLLFIHVRTSETYKRLAMDLLLFKRIGDAVYGEHPYIIQVHINHLWLSKDWATMLLVDFKTRLKCKKASNGSFAHKVFEKYKVFKDTDWETLSYNSHKRPCRVIQKDTHKDSIDSMGCYIIGHL